MPVFHHQDYRDILKEQIQSQKSKQTNLTLDKISNIAGIKKSFLSRVLNKHAHIDHEKLFLLLSFLKMSDDNIEYSCLLNEWQRADQQRFKDHLQRKLNGYKETPQTRSSELPNADPSFSKEPQFFAYYQNFFLPLIHMYLCMDKYAKNPNLLAVKLKISKVQLSNSLKVLEDIGLIKHENATIRVLKRAVHLPAKNTLAKVHQSCMRNAAQYTRYKTQLNNYFFSASFTCNKDHPQHIRKLFLEFLNQVKDLTMPVAGEEVFTLNFDLFSV